MRQRLVVAALAVGLIAAVGAGIVLRSDLVRANSDEARIRQALRDAGFESDSAEVLESVRTELVSSDGTQFHIVQQVPAFSTRREITLAIYADEQIDPSAFRPITTAEGYNIYLLDWEGRDIEGGYETYNAFFLPYDSIDPGALSQLGLPRRSTGISAAGSTHAIAFGLARQQAILGVVVASLVANTESGTGDTFVGQQGSGGDDLGSTQPRIEDANLERFRQDPAGADARSGEISAADREWFRRHMEEVRRNADPPPPPMTEAERERVTNEIREEGRRRYMERHGVSEEVARRHLGHEPQARSGGRVSGGLARVSTGLAGAQALGEWSQQVLDHFENDAALQAAEDCHNNPTNPLAIRAQQQDRANYDRALDQIRAARASNNADMVGRAAGTGTAVAGAVFIPGAPGIALGIGTGLTNATFRELQRERTQQAVAGVTPCDPQPSASSSGGSGSTTQSGTTGGTTGGATGPATTGGGPATGGGPSAPPIATATGTPRVITVTPAPAATPRPNSLRINVDHLHRSQGAEHTISYSAAADLSNILEIKVGGQTVLKYPDIRFEGEGAGGYNEDGTATTGNEVCSVGRTGLVTMKVVVLVDISEVDVFIQGPVQRSESGPQENCPHNVGDGNVTDVVCVFENVDFQPAGGFYRDQVGNNQSGPTFVNRELCTLELAPLYWHDGRPVTGPRAP